MKKIFLSIIILLSSFLSQSQSFEGGILVGLSGSQIDGDEAGGYRKLGPTITTYANLLISPTFSITSGVGYVLKGANSSPGHPFFSATLHYAEIPLYVNIQPKFAKNFSVSVGIAYNYLIKASYDDGVYIQNAQDMGLSNHDIGHYFSINYDITEKLRLRLEDTYSFYPITRPVTGHCWAHNIFLNPFVGDKQRTVCWFNNNVRLSLSYTILWGDSSEK